MCIEKPKRNVVGYVAGVEDGGGQRIRNEHMNMAICVSM